MRERTKCVWLSFIVGLLLGMSFIAFITESDWAKKVDAGQFTWKGVTYRLVEIGE